MDLDNMQIKARVYFPKLNFDGKYDLDARLLVVPIHGKGDIQTNASKLILLNYFSRFIMRLNFKKIN